MPRGARVWGIFLVMGALNTALPFTPITWGQMTVPSGLAATVNASTVVFAITLAALVFRGERLTPARAAGVVLGLAGVATAIGLHTLTALDPSALPQLALVAAAVSYASAAAWARRMLGGLSLLAAAAGMLTGSSLLTVPLALWVDGPPALTHAAATWGALVGLAVLSTAGACLLYYRVLAQAGAGNLGLVTLLTAPIAILLGAPIMGEALPPRALAGFALIALGLAVIDGRLMRSLSRRKDSA